MKPILFALCLIWLPIEVYAQGPLIWEVKADVDGGIDLARAITLSGNVAVVVGNGGEPQEGTDDSDFVIQALGRATGAVRWSDQAFLSTGSVEPVFVASRHDRAYAVGTLDEPGDLRSAFLVRGYDVPNGTLLWENVWHASQGVDVDHPTAIIASATQVIVTGYGENATRDGLAALVRAYDPLSGAIVWEKREGRDGLDTIAWTAAANPNRVLVAGTTSPAGDPFSRDLFVRAYDALSGDLEWEMSRPSTVPSKLAIASGRLLVAGASSSSTYLAELAVKTGALLWEDANPLVGTFSDVAVNGTRIATAIKSTTGFAVRAYDLTTGDMEWQDRPAIAPGFHESIFSVGLNQNVVYVAGASGQNFGNSEFVVRAYDALTGTVLWDDRSHSSVETAAVDLAVGKSRLFVAGYTFDPETNSDFLIRAYDIRLDRPRLRR